MKIVMVRHGFYNVPDDATHLHGVPIQTLVDHFGAELDYVAFIPGQKAIWTRENKTETEVTIHKASDALPGYWVVIRPNGHAVLAHESNLRAVEGVAA